MRKIFIFLIVMLFSPVVFAGAVPNFTTVICGTETPYDGKILAVLTSAEITHGWEDNIGPPHEECLYIPQTKDNQPIIKYLRHSPGAYIMDDGSGEWLLFTGNTVGQNTVNIVRDNEESGMASKLQACIDDLSGVKNSVTSWASWSDVQKDTVIKRQAECHEQHLKYLQRTGEIK